MITLSPATSNDKQCVWQMIQLHLHDLSENIPLDDRRYGVPDENGQFAYRYFEQYWDKDTYPHSHIFLIKNVEDVIGFVMVNPFCNPPYENSAQWNMGEFFLLRKYRGHGFGAQAAALALSQFDGSWTVGVIKENAAVCAFWMSVFKRLNLTALTQKTDFDKWAAVYNVQIGTTKP